MIRWFDLVGAVMFGILLACVLAVTGCDRSQVQDLADAKAGAMAYQQESDPAKRATIADGVVAHLLAGLEQYPLLPNPSASPTEIRSDPAAYATSGAKAQADPMPYVPEHHEQPKPKPPGFWERLRSSGSWLMDSGILIGAICGVVWLMFAIAGWLKWAPTGILWRVASSMFPPIARIGTLWGGASAALGGALTWLADYWWAVTMIAMAVGVVVLWDHWRQVKAWWSKRLAQKP
jgi:hypothetical protein